MPQPSVQLGPSARTVPVRRVPVQRTPLPRTPLSRHGRHSSRGPRLVVQRALLRGLRVGRKRAARLKHHLPSLPDHFGRERSLLRRTYQRVPGRTANERYALAVQLRAKTKNTATHMARAARPTTCIRSTSPSSELRHSTTPVARNPHFSIASLKGTTKYSCATIRSAPRS